METRVITVSTKGQFVIPADIRAELKIEPGTRIAITVEDSRIILEPVDHRFVESLRGMFAGKPSMTDELLKQRREDHARSKY
jgi:AbrB family looped-hinge helix DNA binding protein